MKKYLLTIVLALLGLAQAMAQENEYLPLVREGVKWINEKVIVNNGDTTRYYYTFEISGVSNLGSFNYLYDFRDCHYYTGNENNDSIISSITNYPASESIPDCIFCYDNHALKKAKEEQGLLYYHDMHDMDSSVWHGAQLLYNFAHNYPSGMCSWYPFNEWAYADYYGTEFPEIAPIEIEGYDCRRYAYIEYGDTLAYVVEGIGFDSRDMGDLLTPFTRRPDPNADYQEWCGLCHVVKDGKVIYKGMRYSPNNMTGIDEVVVDKVSRPQDTRYYDLMGRPVGTEVPTTPGIYIHQGKKIVVR